MSEQLEQVLTSLYLQRKEEAIHLGKAEPFSWIFCERRGMPLDLSNIEKRFKRCLRLGELGGFRLYDLRHTFASQLLAAGAPVTYVAAQLGHPRPSTTLLWYGRWIPDESQRLVDTLDESSPKRIGSQMVAKTDLADFPLPQLIENIGAPPGN